MSTNFPTILLFFIGILAVCQAKIIKGQKECEEKIMRGYNKKHRPVKKDADQMQVSISLMIGHIEFVDEHEQTMMLHGVLMGRWVDQYLTWDRNEYNGTEQLNIDTNRLWVPALSLYNSARGHGWNLHMGGLPANVQYTGEVLATGSFTFHVTCLFDFTDYPYDEQICPIVIADWVYDLSKVNLSNPARNDEQAHVRLSYDPLNEMGEKTIVNGWEVDEKRGYRKHCYYRSAVGCVENVDVGDRLNEFWSVLEFGIAIARHAPYFGLTVILPCIFVSLLTLTAFWIDTLPLATAITVFSILLQGLFGWDLIKGLPPGSGGVPKIVSLYGFNLSMTAISFMIHVLVSYLEYILPENIEFPFQMTNVTGRLREWSPFKVQGLSFDPQKLLIGEETTSSHLDVSEQNPPQLITPDESAFTSELVKDETSVQLQEKKPETVISLKDEPSASASREGPSTAKDLKTGDAPMSHVAQQLFVLRRIMFFVFLLLYIIMVPVCLS